MMDGSPEYGKIFQIFYQNTRTSIPCTIRCWDIENLRFDTIVKTSFRMSFTKSKWLVFPVPNFSSGIPRSCSVLPFERITGRLWYAVSHLLSWKSCLSQKTIAIYFQLFDPSNIQIKKFSRVILGSELMLHTYIRFKFFNYFANFINIFFINTLLFCKLVIIVREFSTSNVSFIVWKFKIRTCGDIC